MKKDELSKEANKVLRAMDKGAKIHAWRTYPHPHHYKLEYPMELHKASQELSGNLMAELVTRALVEPEKSNDWKRDRFSYNITGLGSRVARKDLPPVVLDQLAFPGTM